MARTPTVTVTESGTLELPTSIRRRIPTGTRFAVVMNNGDLVLTQVRSVRSTKNDKVWVRFDAARERIAKDFARRGIDETHIRRTIKKLRTQRRAKSGS